MFFVPTTPPMASEATTNASQPKTAVFQWLALQRPMRAAMLFDCFRGDIPGLSIGVLIDTPSLAPAARGGNAAAWPLGARESVLRGVVLPSGACLEDPRPVPGTGRGHVEGVPQSQACRAPRLRPRSQQPRGGPKSHVPC